MALDVDTLLAGPRGRRLCLEYTGVFACYRPSADAAQELAAASLAPVTDETLIAALTQSVHAARCWQDPDEADVGASTSVVRAQLARVAAHLIAAPQMSWWNGPLDPGEQWSVRWDERTYEPGRPAAELLAAGRAETLADEQRARRDRPADPTAPFSGFWWSTPPYELIRSTRSWGPFGPVGLSAVEDDPGFTRATVSRVTVPPSARVFTVRSARDWAELCRRYPMDVTAARRHNWYLCTGRAGDWVIPDWASVAADYDGVHLTVSGYLSAASAEVPVDARRSSVIALWGPDETYWFRDVTAGGPVSRWRRDRDAGMTWREVIS